MDTKALVIKEANHSKRLFFIYNPKAGTVKIKNHLVDIIDIFIRAGYLVTVHSTQGQGDAKKVVKYREIDSYDLIVCCGGDGTLDEVVTGMIESGERIPIGYIPAGSTNDFARSLGLSSNMRQGASEIVDGNVMTCDVGRFNQEVFVYIAAFGMFTEVAYATDQHLKNVLGHIAYILEGIKSLSSINSYKMKFESEGISLENDYIYGMITNSTSVGGIKNITGKDVELDDGKFEVILIRKPLNPIELNSIVVSLASQKFESTCIQCFKTAHLRVKSDENVSWTLDGEFGGYHKEVVIKIEQKALSIMTKQKV